MTAARASLLLALGLSLAPAAARADDAAMARFHHEEASQHYAAQRYEEAIQHFFLAQRLSPNPRTLYNIGVCFQQLGRDAEAYQFLSEYLAAADEVEGAEERRAYATRTLADLSRRLALVEVRSDPPGGRVYVDREELGAFGDSPRTIAVSPGAHDVWVELEGHRRGTARVEAVVGRTVEVSLALPAVVGTLEVRANAASRARVVAASGEVIAEAELPLVREVAPGRYDVEVVAEGRQPWRTIVAVEDGQTATVEATLAIPTAEVTLTSNRLDAQVWLDGELVGRTPLPLAGLAPGSHRLRVASEGSFPWEDEVELAPDARAWVTVTLLDQPEERSTWTWVAGGAGAALLLGALVTGVATLVLRDQLLTMRDQGPGARARADISLESFANEVDALAATTDVLLGAGAVSVGVGLILFFATDPALAPRSTATVNRSTR